MKNGIVELSGWILEAFVKGDLQKVFGLIHPEAIAVKAGTNADISHKMMVEVKAACIKGIPCSMESQEHQLIYQDVNTAVVQSKFVLKKLTGMEKDRKVCKVLLLWERMEQVWKIRHLTIACKKGRDNRQICIHTSNGAEIFLWTGDICYIETFRSKVYIHCLQETIAARGSIQKISDMLAEPFVQIHRSFIVNEDYVKSIRRYEIIMYDNTSLPIPEKKYKSVKERILNRKETDY